MDVNFEAELSSPFNTRDALCVLWAFLSVSCGCPFPPFSSFLVSIVSLDLIHCCICSFGPGSFFFPYQLFARWRVCESRLIYNGTGSHAGQESSTEYSANVFAPTCCPPCPFCVCMFTCNFFNESILIKLEHT
uniref:Uncharacterized protein n=1 Tax=Lates calcarifer TaxID=8187 RepID=A0A4W6EDQ3_LATCA